MLSDSQLPFFSRHRTIKMSAIKVVVLLAALCQLAQGAEYLPVFMWGATANAGRPKALDTIAAEKFDEILAEQLASEPFTVVFVEETLSVEDFSARDARGRTAYPGLREKVTGESVLYLPFVAAALRTLDARAGAGADRVRVADGALSADAAPAAGRFLFVALEDAREGEGRLHMLARHDAFMTRMFDQLLKRHDNVLAVYTARYPSWEVSRELGRQRRALMAAADPDKGFYNVDDKVFIYSSNITYTPKDGAASQLTSGVATLTTNSESKFTVDLQFAATKVEMNFALNQGYWWLDVSVNGEKAARQVYAPLLFSYHCSPKTEFANDNYTLSFENFQTEPFFSPPNLLRFHLAYDCVGFMSVPIWSGLMVVFLATAITFLGVLMMMDIRTMDRFDDPKGKTITITASE